MNKFNDLMGAEPTTYTPKPPTPAQIAAIGAALPEGKHKLTEEQQRAWFGVVLFDKPVSWDGAVFVCGDVQFTPEQIVQEAQ